MKRFLKTYAACLFLTGLALVLSMGSPAGMVLLVLFEEQPVLFWALAALLPVGLALAWTAWRARRGAPEGRNRSL